MINLYITIKIRVENLIKLYLGEKKRMKSVGQIVCAQGTNVIERNVQMRLFQPCHKQVKRKLLGSYHGMMTTAQMCVLKKLFWLGLV